MTCVKWEEQIYLYADGLLAEEEAQILLAHIHQCESCAKLLAEVETINGLLREEAALAAPPEGFAAGVMANLPKDAWQTQEEKVTQPKRQTVVPLKKKNVDGKRFARWGTAVAAAFLVAAVGVGQLPDQAGPGTIPSPQDGLSVANYQPQGGEKLPSSDVISQPVAEENNGNIPDPVSPKEPADPVIPAGENVENPQPRVSEPPSPSNHSEPIKEQTVSGSGEVMLPKVAAGKEKSGIYSLLLLAASEDGDVLNPVVINGDTVEYFIRSAYGTSKWQSNPSAGDEPVLLDDSAKLGAAQSVNTVTKAEWLTDSAYTEAISPLGDMTLLNSMSRDGGLWKMVTSQDTEPKLLHQASGGNILSWSPDGTKAIYTDRDGNLYVVYPTEEVVMLVFEGKVTSVSWGGDSRMIAFSATTVDSNYSAVYSAMLP